MHQMEQLMKAVFRNILPTSERKRFRIYDLNDDGTIQRVVYGHPTRVFETSSAVFVAVALAEGGTLCRIG